MTAEQLIADFRRMLDDHWGYIPAASGETWTKAKQDKATSETVIKYGSRWIGHRVADCSGAFVWACRQHGLSIYHGSNRIARVYVDELLPVSQARPGMAAFKIRKPGQQYYDLKAEYKPGGEYYNGDVLDFYHIGLVDYDSDYVLNAQSAKTGFVRSKIKDNWAYVARLKAVEYTEETTMTRQVTGGTLNMRCSPDKNAALVQRIPNGAIVTIDSYGEIWCRVEYNGKHGYVMTQYLTEPQNLPSEAPDIEDKEIIGEWVLKALKANSDERAALLEIANRIGVAAG